LSPFLSLPLPLGKGRRTTKGPEVFSQKKWEDCFPFHKEVLLPFSPLPEGTGFFEEEWRENMGRLLLRFNSI